VISAFVCAATSYTLLEYVIALSIAGWAKLACRLKNSWASFALASARALAMVSSKAPLSAVALSVASFSNAENWVLAAVSSASTLALLVLWISQG
jgi:hypothetical protein